MRNRLRLLGVMILFLAGSSVFGFPVHRPSSYGAGSTKGSLSLPTIQPDFAMRIKPSQLLMTNGSTASPSLVFTPVNGFAGNVTLSVAVTPTQVSPPIVSFNPSTVVLNASQFGSQSILISIRTTDRTESGLYNVTVTGFSNTLSHSASATVGVTNGLVPSNGSDLVYKARFTATAFLGGSTVLENTFEDLGYLDIEITDLTIASDFGTVDINQCGRPACVLHNQFNPYVSLSPYAEVTTAITIPIPNGTSVGGRAVAITVSWVVCGPSFPLQCAPAPNLVLYDSLVIYEPSKPTPNNATNIPNGFLRLVPAILGGIATIAVVAAGLAFWDGRRSERRNQTMLQYVASAKESLTQKKCANCGAKASSEARFCGNCGHMFS